MKKMSELFTSAELKKLQDTGQWPVTLSSDLVSKFSDRYQVADQLFQNMDTIEYLKLNEIDPDDPVLISTWRDEDIPNKSFSLKHQGPCFGYDVDTMHGPISWYDETSEIKDFVQRRKLYVYDWTKEKTAGKFPELDYFTDMHDTFKPVLQHYLKECYSDQEDLWEKVLYKLMIIQYTVPVSTDETRVSHRKHNTERFGDDHCDETLGGLHLGENFTEFHAKNTNNNEWEFIEGLDKNNMMWMFGEHAEQSGWKPTYHGMAHNPDPKHNQRYSIIFDLQARYKE